MEKILLSIFCSIMFSVAYSQTQSGGMMVGGTLSYYSLKYKDSDTKNTSASFAPRFGYFIQDNFLLGINLSTTKNTSASAVGTSNTSQNGIGPFARYYKFTSNEKFAVFVQGGFTLGWGKTESTTGVEQKSTSYSINIYPGFTYFVTDRWAAELSIRGLSIYGENPDNEGGSDFTVVDFGVSSFIPSIGVFYYFGNN